MAGSHRPSRRRVLLGSAAALLSRAVPGAAARELPLTALSAVEAVRRMGAGELTAEAYAGALLERCQSQRALNAFITLEPDRVLAAARDCDQRRRAGERPGALFGLPVPVKDSVNTRDYPTTAGTPALRHFRPAEDAPLVAALRRQGALVLGKTNLHELSFGWTSNNLAFGAVHNPYDPTRIPGGSSGGTAVAVASGMAPLGVAEDTQGSIRVPAALCGICGLRPTTGRYDTRGCVPISPLFDQVGPHARSVADLALFDAAVAGGAASLDPASLQGVRLGVVRDYFFEGLDPEVARLMEEAMARLRAAGVEFVESRLPALAGLIDRTTAAIQLHDTRVAVPEYLQHYHAPVDFDGLVRQSSPDIRAAFASDVLPGGRNFVTDAVYRRARDVHLPALRLLFADYFARERVAALLLPATMVPAPRIGDDQQLLIGQRRVPFDTAVARNISPGSTAGLPGLVLPVGLSAGGLPVALELDAPAGADRALLALGAAIERELGSLPPPRLTYP